MHPLFFLLLPLLFLSTTTSATVTHRLAHHVATTPTDAPITYFEVTKPINHPRTTPCSYTILHHNFANTYTKPPVTAPYTPPSSLTCPHTSFATIVLEWKATCKGRQFDRIFGVWLGNVELLRSCTAEPRATGIEWKVEKDLTKYYELFKNNQTLAVYIGNVVDSVYTGVYHVEVKLHFYPFPEGHDVTGAMTGEHYGYGVGHGDAFVDAGDWRKRSHRIHPWADSVLPISRDLPLNDGLWFELESSTDVKSKEFRIPRNVYRAVLDVYLSPHENDEFWYSNYDDVYIRANNMTGTPGNGPFREVVVTIDGELVGSIFPFTVIYTGGINPLLWRPITGIGSFNLPTYDIEITPFLEKLLDGKIHTIAFSVTNALNVWYIDANLHLWIDRKSKKTEAMLVYSNIKPLKISSESGFGGLDGHFLTKAHKTMFTEGWVKSSYGNITTSVNQRLHYKNQMVMASQGDVQTVNQTINNMNIVTAKKPGSLVIRFGSRRNFPLNLYTAEVPATIAGEYALVTDVDFAFNERKTAHNKEFSLRSELSNSQNTQGQMTVQGNLVTGGVGSTKQSYKFEIHGDKHCYNRNVSSSNYTILYDQVTKECPKEVRTAHNPNAYSINRDITG